MTFLLGDLDLEMTLPCSRVRGDGFLSLRHLLGRRVHRKHRRDGLRHQSCRRYLQRRRHPCHHVQHVQTHLQGNNIQHA